MPICRKRSVDAEKPGRGMGLRHRLSWPLGLVLLGGMLIASAPARSADEPDLIFRRSTVFKLLSPNDKLATYGIDDPEVEGVACHFTVPEKGGYQGLARACRRSVGYLAGVPANRADPVQGEAAAGR